MSDQEKIDFLHATITLIAQGYIEVKEVEGKVRFRVTDKGIAQGDDRDSAGDRDMTRQQLDSLLKESKDALKFGDGAVGNEVKQTAYLRGIGYALLALAEVEREKAELAHEVAER